VSPRAWSFSQRKGLTPAPEPVQLESLDQRLRNDLWNFLYSELLNTYPESTPYSLRNFWWHHYGQPIEQYDARKLASLIRATILEAEWYEVYDLLEFLASETPDYYQTLGIAADVVAAWHGHTERMTQAVYGRVTDDRLTAASAVFSASAVGQS
jgi:hypothetical protein